MNAIYSVILKSASWAARGATKARTMSNQKRRRAITVPPAYHDGLFLARRASVCGRVVRAGRARIWRRYGHVTVGETGADPARYGVLAPHRRPELTRRRAVPTATCRAA